MQFNVNFKTITRSNIYTHTHIRTRKSISTYVCTYTHTYTYFNIQTHKTDISAKLVLGMTAPVGVGVRYKELSNHGTPKTRAQTGTLNNLGESPTHRKSDGGRETERDRESERAWRVRQTSVSQTQHIHIHCVKGDT